MSDPGPPLHVVATAGHVDHGKSALIQRLTGMDPDRWAEEKRRGLTIDLGFAWCELPSGREIGFVDVPGHERFIRNMLAGVGPVRLVLFVVAADEGWKPQSEEHLAIIDVLGAEGGVIALTKRDLVDDETLELAVSEVRERISGTALEKADIVPCSAVTGAGLRELQHPLSARGAYKLYAGSAERDARIRFYGSAADRSAPALARIRLSAPLVLDVHDRFVLREAGRRETVAGGVILDVDPPTRPG